MWLGKDKVQKSLVEALNRYEKQEELRKSRFSLREWLSRLFSETKPNTKLISFCLEFKKKTNKMLTTLIYLKIQLSSVSKIIVDTDWCQEWNIESLLLKIS